ncbi:hypothetical protein ERJ75_000356500 [Trypanosoma vivax]|uniref:Uncharacterized protein n=1 Tax=Trypanosoma vivax (strain Y486) TaxID=1055687 RepID=G0TUV3_TRYVY|nr:hypothetical protein TRVL_03963 [Trypanosoma vivax]KAH8617685.1 hypothetical protein ERJ75_000356500 [Trypanosoma vivax]CCC47740.1 conserved hypothetical protein [Trypanosoma vivax Y486]
MGAVPSRESLRRGLYQTPDYGQRHHMVLIPLTKEFFPSSNCLLIRQLYESRRDPFVQYYHTYGEGFEDVQPGSGSTGCGATEWRADEFVPFNCAIEDFYQMYVCHAGESSLFDTDEDMIDAYLQNPGRLRPVPCAVAFASSVSSSNGTLTPLHVPDGGASRFSKNGDFRNRYVDEGWGEVDECTRPGNEFNDVLKESTVLSGMRVQVIGFFGDVSGFCSDAQRSKNPDDPTNRIQIFLDKSVGDHNFLHVCLAAMCTYAAQWRNAVMAFKGSRGGPEFPASQVESSCFQKQKRRNGPHSASVLSDVELPYLSPPVGPVIVKSRRANVPMLCFQRVLRSTLVRLVTSCLETEGGGCACTTATSNKGTLGHSCNPCSGGVTNQMHRNAVECGTEDSKSLLPVSFEEMNLVTEVIKMWLDQGILTACIPQEIAERTMRCIVQRIGCQVCIVDILRPKRLDPQFHDDQDFSSIQQSANGVGGSDREASQLGSTVPPLESVDGAPSSPDTKGPRSKGKAFTQMRTLYDLPSEAVVVEAWPEEGVDLVTFSENNKSSVEGNRNLLYWVVGDSESVRQTALHYVSLWRANGGLIATDHDNTGHQMDKVSPNDGKGTASSTAVSQINAGDVFHLSTMQTASGEMKIVLKRIRLPLEELLLSELHNACKLARKADVRAENWVRYSDCRERAGLLPWMMSPDTGDDEETKLLAAEVAQLVGGGSLCLWRVHLGTGAVRILAITPHFLRSPRKKRARRKRITNRLRDTNSTNDGSKRVDLCATKSSPYMAPVAPTRAKSKLTSGAGTLERGRETMYQGETHTSPAVIEPCGFRMVQNSTPNTGDNLVRALPVRQCPPPLGVHLLPSQQPCFPTYFSSQPWSESPTSQTTTTITTPAPTPPAQRFSTHGVYGHNQALGDVSLPLSYGTNYAVYTSPVPVTSNRTLKEFHCDFKAFDEVWEPEKVIHGPGVWYSASPIHTHTCDGLGNFPHYAPHDEQSSSSRRSPKEGKNMARLQTDGSTPVIRHCYISGSDERFGPFFPWSPEGPDSTAGGETERDLFLSANLIEPRPVLQTFSDGSQGCAEEITGSGINVTVRRGLQHYQPRSSLTYSDTNSSLEMQVQTQKRTSGIPLAARSSTSGTYRWDWKKADNASGDDP